LRDGLGLDRRFTLYTFRHWYITIALECGEEGEIVSELAGQVDRASLDFYKKIRNPRLHQASRRVIDAIGRAGTSGRSVEPPPPTVSKEAEALGPAGDGPAGTTIGRSGEG